MASSVSSERAFSSAGITISKRRNRLGADIVEALQGLKSIYRQDTLFREVHTAKTELAEDSQPAEQPAAGSSGDSELTQPGWDDLIEDAEDSVPAAALDNGDDSDDDVYVAQV